MLITRPFLLTVLDQYLQDSRMRVKATLKSGVLLKLLENMNSFYNNNPLEIYDTKPVLLQIRGIVPVLEGGDLWPNRGFYLRVSDSSHATYVSLPNNHDEMILSNKLKLGQYIYIQMLEKSEPVPLLRGITPVPGRRKCEGSPLDIVSTPQFLKLIKFPEQDLIVEKAVMLSSSHKKRRSSRPVKVRPFELAKRRSWNESEILSVKEIAIKPLPRSPKSVLPIRRARSESSDDNSTCSTMRNKIPLTKVDVKKISSSTSCLIGEKKGAETGILWGSLPPNLSRLGKEIIKQRNIALLAATDALQEAGAAERLLNCLSTFSDFNLTEGDVLQPYVDKFFDLQDNLAQSRLITQSLTDSESSVKDALNIAVERKKNAITWIRSALAIDLSPSEATLQEAKRSGLQSEDILLISTSEKDEQPGWTRGSTLASSTALATLLQDECRNLFLGHVEKYLDEVERRSLSDGEIAGMLIKIKKINDWLDNIVYKESKKSCNDVYGRYNSYDPGMEACRRVRNKICDILLNNVERTAMALEGTFP